MRPFKKTYHVQLQLESVVRKGKPIPRSPALVGALNGDEQTAKAGDMLMADRRGVISSIVHGPDQRTRMTPATRDVLFTVYAPPGVGAEPVAAHLGDRRDAVLLVAPGAEVEALEVVSAP